MQEMYILVSNCPIICRLVKMTEKPVTEMRQLSIMYFYFKYSIPCARIFAPSEPLNTPASLQVTYSLPAELWYEVATWLSRPDLKTLLWVPHPLRRFACDLFFQDISLQLDVYDNVMLENNPDLIELEDWHSRRSLEIITRMIISPTFARRVRTLKIRMFCPIIGENVDPTKIITFERRKYNSFITTIFRVC